MICFVKKAAVSDRNTRLVVLDHSVDAGDPQTHNGAKVIGRAALVTATHAEPRSDDCTHSLAQLLTTAYANDVSPHRSMCTAHIDIKDSRSRWRQATNTRSTPLALAVYTADGVAVPHCSIVLYDKALAASGALARCSRALSPASAFYTPLQQLGAYFETHDKQSEQRRRSYTTPSLTRGACRRSLLHPVQL